MRALAPILVAGTLLTLCGCQGTDSRHSSPLPKGYPRIEMPDSTYTSIDSLPVKIAVNAGAETSVTNRGSDKWIDISYPEFAEGRIYLTLNAVNTNDEAAVVDNRLERMALDTAGLPGEKTELVSTDGWRCIMLTTRTSLTTPLHLLAVGHGYILSGVFSMNVAENTPPDSLAPVVQAVERDILTMLKSL
ncbi:MAG: hypothetical protein NC339_05845 [Muribaculaceae bacterium]|nr:hypothetical protein [Muribaculaceae bacterium]